ncbi:nitroreductase family protein [Nitratidesulfovibrio sp. 1201_IL3209]|uniref:nitroreductase family protein n=1 Tax=Nitratidesulfovibrio sp. 1201_IL3209 TaxID=3084053 RepID=UPI002FDA5158
MLDTTGTDARMTRRAVLAVLALLGGTLAAAGLPAPAGRTSGGDTEGMAGLARRALRPLHTGEARAAQGAVTLPPPDLSGAAGGAGSRPLMQALAGRASTRAFREDAIPDQVLGELLWAAWGVNRPDGKRTVPTARNRQGMDVYVVRADGAWRYDGAPHALERAAAEDLRPLLARQSYVATAPVTLVYTAAASEDPVYAAMHAGSMYQGAGLFCASAGLGNVVRASYDEAALHAALRLPADRRIVISQTVGWPRN